MRILPCDDASLEEAAAVLNAGGVAVIPTDTVYGLAAHPAFPAAVGRLYTIKGRESGKKIALIEKVDPTVIGGVLLEMNGQRYDDTIRYRLQKIHQAMIGEG